jgi:peptide/nickel transport system substrate-binding protein
MSEFKLFFRNMLILLVLSALVLSGCAQTATVEATQPPAAQPAEPTKPPAAEPTQPPAAEPTQPQAPVEEKPALTPDRLVPEIVFVFSTAEHDPARNEVGILLTNEWEKLGLRVKAQPLDYEKQVDLYKSGEGFNAFTLGYDGRPERLDPDVLLRRIYYTGLNYMGFSDPEVDAMIDAERAEMDINKRQEIVFKIQEVVASDGYLPTVVLYHDSDVDAYNSELWENVSMAPGQGTYNYWTLMQATPKTDHKNFRVAHNELPVNLNPFFETSGSDTEVMRELYDTIARVGLDGLPTPCAAESWEVVDPTTIHVVLRQGMKFNDGVPVTAKDVKFSYDIQKEQGSSIYKPFLANIDSIDATDDYNLTFHLAKPDAAIYMATFAQIYILPEHIWSKVPDPKVDFDNNSKPVGSGPFILADWRPNEELTATKNKDYQFPVQPESYTVIQYANPDAIFQALVDQEADTNYDPLNAVQVELAKNYPYLTVMTKDSHQIRLVGFNVRFPPFDDPKFRDAIGYTIDFDTIVNVILKGAGIAGAGVIAPANEFWHNPNQKIRLYDPAMARELLAAAGYEWDAQGLLYMPAP